MPSGMPKVSATAGHGHPDVVVENQNGALIGPQRPESPFELVAVGDQVREVADGRRFKRFEFDFDGPSTPPAGGVEAGVDDQAVEPGIESLRVAQARKVTPGSDVCLLDRVARELRVPEDEAGDRFQPRDGRAEQHGKGVMIAPACPLDEFPLVHSHLVTRPFGRVQE